ncbi:MAG TPA: cytochrome (ubi)quinol oxidase subunit III [Caulobacteraceae bacterium]
MSAVGNAIGGDAAPPDAERRPHGAVQTRIVVGYGFWLFLLSDFVLFSCFFASYAVLRDATAGGPTEGRLFDLDTVAWETACLLLSSFTSGMANLAAGQRNQLWFQVAMAATGLLGAAFLALELSEFARFIGLGAEPQRSAFLSAFFSLVGCHGLHITCGLLWLLTVMAQALAKGFRADIQRRILCFTLFWHALDIVWVGIFTVVYLTGVGP